MTKHIVISSARIHNLKNINVRIPKEKLVVVTGVSGSGKSSLVFDIIFEEGKRQYLQSIGMLPGITEEDKFDQIAGIGPTVAVQQAIIRQSNPRSVVGTKTKILAYLGLLYAREGRMACSICGTTVGGDLVCERCGNAEERLEANYFSANSPKGMCLQCEGRGVHFELVMENLVPYGDITLTQMLANAGVLASFGHLLRGRLKPYVNTPFSQMPDDAREHILYGVQLQHPYPRRSLCLFSRLRHLLSRGKDVGGMMVMIPCPQCQGYRVGEEARRVTLGGKHIGQVGYMTIVELQAFLKALPTQAPLSSMGHNLIREVLQKTHYLVQVGLGHLTPYRQMPTLSGGEIQRIFLTYHLDSKMDSLIYVLDEPTVGLHEVEKADLLEQITALRSLGNTVIVVEHDRNTIEQAQHVIDFGPLAGTDGGEIVYEGDYAGLLKSEQSVTGQYLSGRRSVPRKAPHEYATITETTARLTLHHAQTHNLKNVTVRFPLGILVGVAGVSGSGKSSLVSDTLIPLLGRHFADLRERVRNDSITDDDIEFVLPSPVAERLDGAAHIAGYSQVSQAPIGRRSDSNPATYVNIWSKVRTLFARQPLAEQRRYTPGHFSFNAKGACPECKGKGRERFWLGGNSFVTNVCIQCHGKRYLDEILDITYQGANIVDVLNMSVSDAATLFRDTPSIHATLSVLEQTGMGYITLGQPSSTLSGGEAQRIKLAKEIGRRRKGNILYVLDEPTTGLSLYDTANLLTLLDTLVKRGNSVIVIEHDPTVLSYCDWLIELGPGGGNEGGEIIAQGSPFDLKQNPRSQTGPFLEV
ncbi:MAG: excinuclease ABC subunit UvrA [Chloroflexota bacterium]|nr:excinuclease ABC subunit UvrA [Chloroflexota bacterium]